MEFVGKRKVVSLRILCLGRIKKKNKVLKDVDKNKLRIKCD